MSYDHNNSMSEQGNFEWLEVVGTQGIRISAGVTNIRVTGSSTPVINRFKTLERPGRKLRIWAASDTGASVVINDVANHIVVTSSTLTLDANEYAEFMCVPQASTNTLVWVQMATTGANS